MDRGVHGEGGEAMSDGFSLPVLLVAFVAFVSVIAAFGIVVWRAWRKRK